MLHAASAPKQALFASSASPSTGYLGAVSKRSQPLCGSPEGWGPLSPSRFDFTPCFLDVWVVAVSLFGIVGGCGAIWLLYSKRKPAPVAKDWQFYMKLIVLVALMLTVFIQAGLQISYYPEVWIGDFRFWSTVCSNVSLSVIFCVQYLEQRRSRVPNGVVLFFWLSFLIVSAVKLRSLISQQAHVTHFAFFLTYCLSTGLAALVFVIEWLVPKKQSAYDALGDEGECPYEFASVFSVLAFSWMTPMMKHGYKSFLRQDDLWALRKRDTAEHTGEQFNEAWNLETGGRKPSLWFALFRAYGGPYLRATIFKTFSDTLNFVQPQLLRLLISFVDSYQSESPQPVVRGAAIALGMFAVSATQTVCLHQYFQRSFETGMRIKSGLTGAIYAKSLKLSTEGRAAKSSGDIVNYMSVDVQRLQDLAQYGQMLWSAPFQLILCMASLYQLVGISFLAGIGIMIALVPVNGVMARLMKKLQQRQMKNKDARTRLMTEILNNQKSIKLYAWGNAFMKKLNMVRNEQELVTLRKIGAAQAFANFTWSSTPFLVACLTFTVFVYLEQKPLTTDLVFPALTLFNLLTFPLTMLPMIITAIVEASVAIKRLRDYFTADELQPDAVVVEPSVEKTGDESVRIKDGTFTWNRYENKSVLESLDFSTRKGDLSCIVGRVGAGKSSFLEALLGNLFKTSGKVTVRGAVAYVAQSSWVMNASVRENIVFGHRWDPTFYERTIRACAFKEDFASLPDADETQVGERGISLSGGQKARLTLARAVYARADIYLLDDCLSAVDQHVGRHLIEHVLGAKGLLGGKTRILATNSIPVLVEANHIVFLEAGRIVESGTYDDLLSQKSGFFSDLIRTANNEGSRQPEEPKDGASASSSESISTQESNVIIFDEEIEEYQEADAELIPVKAPHNSRKESSLSLRRASTASFRGPRGKLTDEEETGMKTRQSKETSEQGKVKWGVYAEYARNSNLVAVFIYLLMLLGAQTASIGGNVWLKDWAELNTREQANPEVGKYIGIYFAFGVGSAALVVVQTLILWIFCSIESSRKLHEKMAVAIFRSPMSFFETTPTGRILNRFSSDIYRVDEVLARTFNMLFVNTARALFTLVVISATTPVFIALIVPLALLYLYIQRYYLRTSRELKRLDSVSRSPIFAHFQESLSGISTIRAFRQQKRFLLENEWRIDSNISAYFPSISANRWLAVRLEFLGSVIILAAAGFSITSVVNHSGLSAGLVGLSMSYALQITQSLNWIVRQTVEVETNIVSVERVLEYARLPSEAPEVIPNKRPAISWPAQGAVAFDHYSTRYRPGLDLVLKDICLNFQAHEKIGVVGRTGAGKSSLTLSLFRIIEPVGGHIDIDNLDTSSMGLLDLRRRLAIIPQDAALFEGTVRDNLDPGHVHDDTELWSVLEHARLREYVGTQMTGKLDAKVHEGGSNLSQGQRQLVSLARALLAPSNILVLDEATAAVDVQTDSMLQTTLRSSAFKDRTIITIAHRINTILDSDRIVVLEKGRVAEFDTPTKLIESRGLFYELVREAGLEGSLPAPNR
ncbi:MAG: hypothetical protein M1828_001750 [Chrysothrix sp. TS-e1954]|nr:MAG: hypothetical protein M1828_001750 [Chrysothrix sp. TS-e1954]